MFNCDNDSRLSLPGYHRLIIRNRENGTRGGVGLFINDDIVFIFGMTLVYLSGGDGHSIDVRALIHVRYLLYFAVILFTSMGGRRSPAVACWASDHWVASSNPLRGKFRH